MHRIIEGQKIEQPLSLQSILDCKDDMQYSELRNVFISARLRGLLAANQPTIIEAKPFGMHEGFIHPDSVIHVTAHEKIPGFKVDDMTIFENLVDALRKTRSIPDAVQTVIDSYFRINHRVVDADVSDRRVRQYAKHKPHEHLGTREIAGAHVAMCAEKSAVAQNLITFLGNRSWLMDSYARLTRRDGIVDDGQHLYNVIQTAQNDFLLYDASHPFEISDESNEIVATQPAQFKITTEQFASLKKGTALHLNHREKRTENGQQRLVLREYTYGGIGSVRK